MTTQAIGYRAAYILMGIITVGMLVASVAVRHGFNAQCKAAFPKDEARALLCIYNLNHGSPP